ncbi:MAG TPA: hypothetical protein VFY90_04015 [Tepidiformaceae bacterium]|nr:hypothetical protein [Tepidiformaceae bacterium]
MPEGLSAAEAHKELKHHEHSPRLEGRRGRILQICEALVLAAVTLTAAWSGFAAAKWGTESRLELAAASTARSEANRAVFSTEQIRNYDASTFNAWFTAWTLDRADKMKIAERRFRPAYKVAFEAWRKTDPETNPNAPPGPSFMPEYVIPAEARAAALDKKADAYAAEGADAGVAGDQYVRVTVVLAGVLFLIGIGSTFAIAGVRYILLVVGAALLVSAIVLITLLPSPPA